MAQIEAATLLVATGNANKAKEIGEIIECPVEMVELDIEEIQSLSVEEVASAKAQAAYAKVGRPVLIDDTGMFIAAIGGLPGAFVTWFLDVLGPAGVIELIKNSPSRKAYVETAIGYHDGDKVHIFVGKVHGTISETLRGDNGFGYDPIFIPDGKSVTYAEMSSEEKNSVSMRKLALEKLRNYLIENPPKKQNDVLKYESVSKEELVNLLESFKEVDTKKASEVAYVLAVLARRDNELDIFKEYRDICLSLSLKNTYESLEECVPHFIILGGVLLPSLFHEGVVRERLFSRE
jgi:XTP/dITP diphosphohydrolase